ncbi:MAG: hypothetical protein JWN41_435, partial [Thermoleophilia bacterium]|nr:hypothetical protein [Thermoleophilia bacterium]
IGIGAADAGWFNGRIYVIVLIASNSEVADASSMGGQLGSQADDQSTSGQFGSQAEDSTATAPLTPQPSDPVA